MAVVDLSKSKTHWPVSILIRRVLWSGLLEHLVRWWPKPMSFVRVWALRAMGARIGAHCLIMPGVKVLMPWHLTLEDHVAIGRNVDLYNFSPITVRRMSVVSQDTTLCTGSHDFRQPHMPLTHAPIVIGSECWVAAQTFVCPGVEIADGVVVGARSLVTRSLTEGWSVYAGHPARRVGPRVMADQDVRAR